MLNQILKIIDEQGSIDDLLIDLDNAKNDQEVLHIARKIIVKRTEYGFLRTKIEAEFNASLTGGGK